MMFLRSDKSNPVSFGLFYFFKGQWISKHIFMEKNDLSAMQRIKDKKQYVCICKNMRALRKNSE